MLTVREAFFEVARQLGLTTMFGNPGSTEEPFLKDFPTDFRYVLALQEAPAVAMADGYSQRTGRPALVNLHTAAGMGNAVGNIESAWYNRAPLIITAGQQTREMLLLEPYLTNVHPELVPQPFVKWACQPARAEDVPAALMRAYAAAVLPPAGPVFLSIPMDDGDQPCPRLPMIRTVSRRLSADQDALAAVIAALIRRSFPGAGHRRRGRSGRRMGRCRGVGGETAVRCLGGTGGGPSGISGDAPLVSRCAASGDRPAGSRRSPGTT